MAKTKNPIAMQAADKEDAVLVAITRDGKMYLGTRRRCLPDDLPPKVKDLLTNKLDKTVLRPADSRAALRESGGRGGQPARGGRGSAWVC